MTVTVRRIPIAQADQLEAKTNAYLAAHPGARLLAAFAAPGGDLVLIFQNP